MTLIGERIAARVAAHVRVDVPQPCSLAGSGDHVVDRSANQLTTALLDTSLPREQRKKADELLTHIQTQMKKLN